MSSSGSNPALSDDYSLADPMLQFAASPPTSNNEQNAVVSITDDECYEPDETFTVEIASVGPSACSSTKSPYMYTITIQDNDCK